MNVFCKFAVLILNILLFSTVIAAPQNTNEQSIIFQVNQDDVAFNNSTLESATLITVNATNEYGVQLKLKKDAAIKLRTISSQNIGKKSRITLNGKLISSPTIQSELSAEFIVMGLSKIEAENFVESFQKQKSGSSPSNE